MGQVFARHDETLRDKAFLQLNVLQDGADGTSTLGTHRIMFQFPPVITSDNRSATWSESEMRGTEPVAIFATSGPREITLSWTYIVDGGIFTTSYVAKEVKTLRGYYAAIRAERSDQRNLIVKFQMWGFGGRKEITARIKSIGVKHSETIIIPKPANANNVVTAESVDAAYPLRTDITLDLRLWTQSTSGAEEDATQVLDELDKSQPFEWY